jgi:O-antigen ligase
VKSLKVNLDKLILGLIVCYPLVYYVESFLPSGNVIELHHLYDFTILALITLVLTKESGTQINIIVFPLFIFLFLSIFSFTIKGNLSSGFFGYYHRWLTFLLSILLGIYLAKKESISAETYFKYLNVFVFLCLLFGLLQIVIGDMPFMNGRYRLAGQYRIRPVVYSLNLFICLAIYILRINKYGKGKYHLNYVVLFTIFILLYLTHTRLTLLVALVLLFFSIKLNWRYKIGLAGASLGVLFLLFTQTDVLHRFQLLFIQMQDITEYHGDGSLLLRVQVTLFMLGKLAENWFLGIGPGMFNQVWEQSFGEAGMSPHFGVLTILVENGLLGTSILLVFLGTLFYKIYINRFKNPYLAKIFIVVFLLYYIGSTFNTPLYKTELVFMFNTLLFYFVFKDLIFRKYARFKIIRKEAA